MKTFREYINLIENAQTPVVEGTGIPGNQHWIDSIKRAKSSGATDGYELYNMFQNVPKRHFLDFANAVGGVKIDPAFQRELERAKQKGIEKNLRQDRNIVRQTDVEENQTWVDAESVTEYRE